MKKIIILCFSLLMPLAAVAEDSVPTNEFLAYIAKIDACAMALYTVNEPVTKVLEAKAEQLMQPYYTKELDAMSDEEYNQIAWVKVYNAYYLKEQDQFQQTGTPAFAREAAQEKIHNECLGLAEQL